MKHLYHPNRGVKTDAVVRIIVDDVVRNKSVPTAMKNFLEYVRPLLRATPLQPATLGGLG